MSEAVKAAIDAKIRTNGRQEITGAILNGVLKAMVDDYDLLIGGKVSDAPSDGQTYARKDGAWVLVQAGTIYDAGSGIDEETLAEGIIAVDFDIVLDKETAADTYQPKLNPENGIIIDASNNIKLDEVIEMPSLDISVENELKVATYGAASLVNHGYPISFSVLTADEAGEEEVSAAININDDETIEVFGEVDFDRLPNIKHNAYTLPPALRYGVLHENCIVVGTTNGDVKCSGQNITDVIVNNGTYTKDLSIGNEGGVDFYLYTEGTLYFQGAAEFDTTPRMADNNGDYLDPALLADGFADEAVSLAGLDNNDHITKVGLNIAVVDALPASPDANTLYFVKEA